MHTTPSAPASSSTPSASIPQTQPLPPTPPKSTILVPSRLRPTTTSSASPASTSTSTSTVDGFSGRKKRGNTEPSWAQVRTHSHSRPIKPFLHTSFDSINALHNPSHPSTTSSSNPPLQPTTSSTTPRAVAGAGAGSGMTTAQACALLRSQPAHYATVQLHLRRYTVTPGDILTLPRMRSIRPGTQLSLDQLTELGSRDLTLRGGPFLPTNLVSLQALVLDHIKGPLERVTKFKRRKRYSRTTTHKQPFTRLRIGDFIWHSPASSVSASAPTINPPINQSI